MSVRIFFPSKSGPVLLFLKYIDFFGVTLTSVALASFLHFSVCACVHSLSLKFDIYLYDNKKKCHPLVS